MIHFLMNFNCINHFSARLEVSTKNINYKGFTLAHFVLTQFLICKRSLPITIFLIGLNLSVVSCRRLASDLADSPRCLPIMYEIYQCFLRSVERASLYNLVNETNLVHCLFLLYFVNFIFNLYMFRTSPGPSSGGTAVFLRHLVLVILYS